VKRQKQAVTAGLIVANVGVNGAERERKREGERERGCPPDWSSILSPGRREKCRLRC